MTPMRAILLLVPVICLIASGCGKKELKPSSTPTNAPSGASGNPLTAPVDYLGAVAKAKKSAARTVDMASLNQAIQLFHASEDRFPADLNELVQKQYIARLPTPSPGTRLIYDPRSGAVRVIRQ
jgi:hypothetical protein